jgi:hypothetical protein
MRGATLNRPVKLLEKDIERTCTDFLACDGWRPFKMEENFSEKKLKRTGEAGMADHLYIRYDCLVEIIFDHPEIDERKHAEVLWIEFKRKGGKAAQHQKDWHTLERKRGALTLIAGEDFPASIEGFQEWYRGSGLQRRADR